MISTTTLLLLALLKTSTAKLLLSSLIISLAIIHAMITISLDDRKKDMDSPIISYFSLEAASPNRGNRLRSELANHLHSTTDN
ncbi:hypothetical protein BJX70DRAFT_354741 [Aspergillus crustosus]